MDEEKVGLKVDDEEENKEEDNDGMEVSDEDTTGRMTTKKRTGPRRPRRK